jgi:hypothetical protein
MASCSTESPMVTGRVTNLTNKNEFHLRISACHVKQTLKLYSPYGSYTDGRIDDSRCNLLLASTYTDPVIQIRLQFPSKHSTGIPNEPVFCNSTSDTGQVCYHNSCFMQHIQYETPICLRKVEQNRFIACVVCST